MTAIDPVGDLIPADPRIRYLRETPRRVLGDKRNRLCELARGEIIVHWDDDDWHGRDRIARQVAALRLERSRHLRPGARSVPQRRHVGGLGLRA